MMDHTNNLSEQQLIKEICSGDKSLFKTLIRKCNSYLYKTGRSYGYNHHDTQDLMQDAFIEAYLNLKKFENRSSFKTWVTKIMISKCYHRTKKFSYKYEKAVEVIHEVAIPAYTNKSSETNRIVMSRELHKVIEDALLKLPLEYRLVFLCRELNGLSVAETADALSISESNVKVRLNRARAMLQKEIEKSYSKSDIFEFNLLYCDIMVKRVMENIEALDDKAKLN